MIANSEIVRLRKQTFQLNKEAQKKYDLCMYEDRIKDYLQNNVPDVVFVEVLHKKFSLYYFYNDVPLNEPPNIIWYYLKHIVNGVYPKPGITYQLSGEVFDYKNLAENEVCYGRINIADKARDGSTVEGGEL